MQSTGFRLASVGITLLLLTALVLVLVQVSRDNPLTAPSQSTNATVEGETASVSTGSNSTLGQADEPSTMSEADAATIEITSSAAALTTVITSTPVPRAIRSPTFTTAASLSLTSTRRSPANAIMTATVQPATAPGDAQSTPRRTWSVQQETAANWQVFANRNFINDITTVGDRIWLATSGGVVTGDVRDERIRHFTAGSGLADNHATSVVHCPLSDLGLVFGTMQGHPDL